MIISHSGKSASGGTFNTLITRGVKYVLCQHGVTQRRLLLKETVAATTKLTEVPVKVAVNNCGSCDAPETQTLI